MGMTKLRGLILLLLLLIVFIFYFMSQNREIEVKGTKVMDFVTNMKILSNSDFLFETVKNKRIEIDVEYKIFKIKGMEDKTVFLKVFGWNCKFCKKEIPELVDLKRQLGDAFEIIAIEAQQHSEEESLKYIKEYGINYHIVSGDSQADFYAYLQEKYGWTGIIPLTIVISKGGSVLAFEIGSKSYSLSELMKAALLRE
jgi:thiol-disulfide isomerase/thioredoxin